MSSIKFISILVCSLLILPCLSYADLDAPHNVTESIGCESCHEIPSTEPKLLPPLDPVPLPEEIDTTAANVLCISCHNPGGQAPDADVQTHSSLVTDNSYGNWTVECWVCHNQHIQAQNRENGSTYGMYIRDEIRLGNIKLFDGLFNPQVDSEKTGRKPVIFLGSTGPNSFADGDMTIDGICEVCHTKTTHWRNDGSLASMGVHDGQQGGNCMSCHPHDRGFAVTCDDCHDFPPGLLVFNPTPTGSVTAGAHTTHTDKNYSCEYCHAASVGTGPTHNSGDDTVTMGFSLFNGTYQGGIYNGQTTASYNVTATSPLTDVSNNDGSKTCSNLYCHGTLPDGTNWGGGTDRIPVWDGSVSCGDCHRATDSPAPTLGSHTQHTQAWASFGGGYQYACSTCHKNPSSDDSLHANNTADVVFNGNPMSTRGVYNGSNDMLGTYGSCTDLYCHSTAQSSPPGDAPEYRSTPVWGTPMSGCGNCHYYSSGTPLLATGNHEPHWYGSDNRECYTCHNYTETDDICFSCHDNATGIPKSTHANYNVEVLFLPMLNGNYSGTGQPHDAYGSCTNTYCHSDGKSGANPSMFPVESGPVNWDGQDFDPQDDAFSCNNCHPYPPVNDSHYAHVTQRSYECSNCHSVTTQDNTTINTWGNLSGAPGHINTLFDLNPSGQFWHGPTSQFYDIDFVYTPMTVSGSEGGECSSNTCHQRWGFTDPIRWYYATINSSFGYTETCTPDSTINVTITNTGGSGTYECNFDWGDGSSNSWGPCVISHDYTARDTYSITWQARDSDGVPMGDTNPGIEVIAVCNEPPVVDFTLADGGSAGRDVVLNDLSFDTDFDVPNHVGPGEIKIVWDGWNCGAPSLAVSSGAADMIDSAPVPASSPPYDREHFFQYSANGNYDVYIAVRDNAGEWVCSSRKRYFVQSTSVAFVSDQGAVGDAVCNSLAAAPVTFLSFQFDTVGLENWSAINHLTPLATAGGMLTTSTTGTDPYMRNDCVVLNGSDSPILEVRMKTSCVVPGDVGRFFWTTGSEPVEDGTKFVDFSTTLATDGAFHIYTADFSGHAKWMGQDIRTLRFDPGNQSGCTIEIDYIQEASP